MAALRSSLAAATLLLGAAGGAAPLRLYPLRDDPLASPVQHRHWVKAPSVFGNTTHFCGYRGNADWADLEAYQASGLGNIIWPTYGFLLTPNLTGRLDDIKRRGMVLVDLWDYVPGDSDNCGPYKNGTTGPGMGGVCQFRAPRKIMDLVNEKLGDSFTGMDNGEQDGRWIGYATQMSRPAGANAHPDRLLALQARGDELKRSFLQFSRHFQRMTDDLGSRLSSLNSIWFPHYFAKTGLYTSLGAETAQGLPNAQLFYAFLRGAAKAYGKKWWGNASIWNRWGHKTCLATNCTQTGTSLSLLRRLMYSQILYNSQFFGYEGAQTCRGCDAEGMAGALAEGAAEGVAEALAQQALGAGYGGLAEKPLPLPHGLPTTSAAAPPPLGPERLTPIGNIQIAAKELVAQHPDLGAMLTQCAVVFDFFAGYAPPRHLYTGEIYRAWGNLPFESDDFWAHGVLDVLYPNYEDSSYFTSERGFQVETPFGDATDILLSDAPSYILNRYPVVIIASRLRSTRKEIAEKLVEYVEGGGTLVLTADASEALGQPLFGAAVPSMDPLLCKTVPANTTVTVKGENTWSHPEPHVWRLCPVLCQSSGGTSCTTIATIDGATAAVEVTAGKGKMLLLGSSGVTSTPVVALPIPSNVGAGLSNPYPLLQHAKFLLGERLAAQTPFTAHAAAPGPLPWAPVGDDLSVITTRVTKGKYVIGLANNALAPQSFKLQANPALGTISAITEIPLLDGPDGPHPVTPATPGYKPNGHWNVDVGNSTNTTIAGLDVRLFTVDVDEVAEDIATPPMPLAPRLRALPLPELGAAGTSMMDSILLRPTFFDHFDTVVVDWQYIAARTAAALATEGRWAYRQSLSTVVDFTSGMNLYPDLRLCNNSADDYARSIATIEGVLSKMATLVNATTATEATATYSSHAIISLHRGVENGYSGGQVAADFVTSMRHLSAFASAKNVTLHLRLGAPDKPPGSITAALGFLRSVNNSRSLKVAVSTAALVSTNTTASEVRDLVMTGKLGMLLASAPVIDPLTKQDISNYGPLAGCLDQHLAGGPCGTATAAILAQATNVNQSVLVVVDAALPQGLESHQDAFFLESKALTAIAALPFPPPVPPPPLPCELSHTEQCVLPAETKATAGSCYTLGAELCGLCEIRGRSSAQSVNMHCDGGTVMADYAVGGGWAGAYGDRFGGLRPSNLGCTKIRLEYSDRWNITLSYAGQSHSWALAPPGYLPPANVTDISCGSALACPADGMPSSQGQVNFSCVSPGLNSDVSA
jgi:hypothetical protein